MGKSTNCLLAARRLWQTTMSITIVVIVRLLARAFMEWLLVVRVALPRGYAQKHGRSIPLADVQPIRPYAGHSCLGRR